jgi:hypothetical protein
MEHAILETHRAVSEAISPTRHVRLIPPSADRHVCTERKSEEELVSSNDIPWQDLVVAILSVNQYSLEKTYQSLNSLEAEGLFNPENLAKWNLEEIVQRLNRSGYSRGTFMTKLFALRLSALGQCCLDKGTEAFSKVISDGNKKAIEQLLLPINGIGPKVLENLFLLRGIR